MRVSYEALGRRLVALRKAKRLQQKAIARALGVHPSKLSRIETGSMENIPVQTLFSLASGYQTTVGELLAALVPGFELTARPMPDHIVISPSEAYMSSLVGIHQQFEEMHRKLEEVRRQLEDLRAQVASTENTDLA